MANGLADVSARAMMHARNHEYDMVACEVAWLDDVQLIALMEAAEKVAAAAQAELNGRRPVQPKGPERNRGEQHW